MGERVLGLGPGRASPLSLNAPGRRVMQSQRSGGAVRHRCVSGLGRRLAIANLFPRLTCFRAGSTWVAPSQAEDSAHGAPPCISDSIRPQPAARKSGEYLIRRGKLPEARAGPRRLELDDALPDG